MAAPETDSDGQYVEGPEAKTPTAVGMGEGSAGQAQSVVIDLDTRYGGKAPKLRELTACTDYLLQVLQRIFTISAKKGL